MALLKKQVKKPDAKKAEPEKKVVAKKVIAKPVAKKVEAKKSVAKPVAKKVEAAKKVVAKSVAKPVAKKVEAKKVNKSVAKKIDAKKSVAKKDKSVNKKPVVQNIKLTDIATSKKKSNGGAKYGYRYSTSKNQFLKEVLNEMNKLPDLKVELTNEEGKIVAEKREFTIDQAEVLFDIIDNVLYNTLIVRHNKFSFPKAGIRLSVKPVNATIKNPPKAEGNLLTLIKPHFKAKMKDITIGVREEIMSYGTAETIEDKKGNVTDTVFTVDKSKKKIKMSDFDINDLDETKFTTIMADYASEVKKKKDEDENKKTKKKKEDVEVEDELEDETVEDEDETEIDENETVEDEDENTNETVEDEDEDEDEIFGDDDDEEDED